MRAVVVRRHGRDRAVEALRRMAMVAIVTNSQRMAEQRKETVMKTKKNGTKKVAEETKDVTPSIETLLAEGEGEKSKKEVKAVKKVNGAKAKDEEIADKDLGKCAICGKEIKKGHFVGRLIADATHPARLYHAKTCGAGTENWKAFKGNGKTPPEKPPVSAGEPGGKKKGSKKSVGKTGKGTEGAGKNQFGHYLTSPGGQIDALLLKGAAEKDFAAIKVTIGRVRQQIRHYGAEHPEIKVTEKDGHFKITV